VPVILHVEETKGKEEKGKKKRGGSAGYPNGLQGRGSRKEKREKVCCNFTRRKSDKRGEKNRGKKRGGGKAKGRDDFVDLLSPWTAIEKVGGVGKKEKRKGGIGFGISSTPLSRARKKGLEKEKKKKEIDNKKRRRVKYIDLPPLTS